jgi:membrane fusion protein (multidrug efflux system)
MKLFRFRRLVLGAFFFVTIAVLAKPGYRLARYYLTHVSTDDAYVDATVMMIAPRIQGTVYRVYVDDNYVVKAGDLLVELDPRDYAAALASAQAELENARQTVDQEIAAVASAESALHLFESQLRQAQLDYARAKALRQAQVVSQDYYDHSLTALRIAEANRALGAQELERARAALGLSMDDHERYARPIVRQAEAALTTARLNLSYTKIYAPLDGVVTHKTVQVGNRVQPGEPMMTLVPVRDLWITANFKETQLTNVRVGQKAEVTADIYPGYVYHGYVDSIAQGTGQAFALLPPENATGNWVKVVQRVPVKILIDDPIPKDKQLRIGLSVEASIDTTDTRGPLLTSILQQQHRIPPPGAAVLK